MSLIPLGDSGRCFSWLTLNDFSDGDSKQQILAAKFRTFEAANNFKRIFNECVEFARDAQKDLKNKSSKKITDRPTYLSALGKENKENVDSGKKGNLSKEILSTLEHSKREVLSNPLSNVKLVSQDDEQK
nr:E3 SUMO protein ligase RanBP2 [Hymenolepis microstoma]